MRALWMSALLATGLAAQARELVTVEDAVSRAIARSPQLLAAKERQEAAGDLARSTRGQLLPSVAVTDEFQHYDRPFDLSFPFPGAPVSPTLRAREQNTNTLVVAARQPLLGLGHLSQELSSANASAEAAGAQARAVERSVREAVETSYLRLFQARAAVQVAQTSEQQLGEQISVQQARLSAGAATTADLLRVEVARANIHQQALLAGVQEKSARTQLLTLLDVPLDADVDFAEPTALEEQAARSVPSAADVSAEGFTRRPELLQAVKQAEAAEAGGRARLFSLLPELDLEAAYLNVQGQVLAEQESKFIGAKLTWPLWTWGARWYAYQAAHHQGRASRFLVEDTRRQLRMETSARVDQLSALIAAVEVATKAEDSAKEAYRVTEALVAAGSGTTTDLLDAQAALTQARLNIVRARYDRALAWVALQRAKGE